MKDLGFYASRTYVSGGIPCRRRYPAHHSAERADGRETILLKERLRGGIGLMHLRRHDIRASRPDRVLNALAGERLMFDLARHCDRQFS
jgi:hypothetical protein